MDLAREVIQGDKGRLPSRVTHVYSAFRKFNQDEGIDVSRRSSSKQKSEGMGYTRIPLKVREDKSGRPHDVLLGGQIEHIASVVKQWDVSEVISGEKRLIKSYYEIITGNGECLRILRNQVTGSWYREDPAQEG